MREKTRDWVGDINRGKEEVAFLRTSLFIPDPLADEGVFAFD